MVREVAGKEGQPADSVSLAYYRTSDADTLALDQYIDWTSTGWSFPYIVGIYDCRDYALAGLDAANLNYGHNAHLDVAPNYIFDFAAAYANQVRGEKGKKVDPEYPSEQPHSVRGTGLMVQWRDERRTGERGAAADAGRGGAVGSGI
jgi:hypothetical protein